EKLALGADATLSARADLAPSLEAPMVFLGYGMSIPEVHYDDLAGIDLKGKIAVYVNAAGPVEAPGPLKSHHASAVERWAALRKAGATARAPIATPRTAVAGRGGPNDPPGEADTENAGNAANPAGRGGRGGGGRGPVQPAVILSERGLQETIGQSISLTIT